MDLIAAPNAETESCLHSFHCRAHGESGMFDGTEKAGYTNKNPSVSHIYRIENPF